MTSVNAKEVLVGTDFYSNFTYTSYCACGPSKYPSAKLPAAGNGVSGTIKAILNYDVPYMTTTGYQFLDPLTNTDFMIQ
jgi:hypothetical protein